jgi:hypothetical protein
VLSFRLHRLPVFAKIGVTAFAFVLLLGLAASGLHLHSHYHARDELPGLTLDDLRGAFHGVDRRAPLWTALAAGHPDGLPARERDWLIAWLSGPRISEDFDNLDLGDAAPAEILSRRCNSCHSRQAAAAASHGTSLALEYFDDVKKVAFSRRIAPTPMRVIIASAHAHALAMATMSLVVALLLMATRWPRRWVSLAIGCSGIALAADLASWFLARAIPELVWLIALAGIVYSVATCLMLLAILVDLWRPASEPAGTMATPPETTGAGHQ